MRKLLAGVIAGLVFGITGTAVAGQHYYWSERGTGYACEGISSGVVCNSGNYRVGTTRSFVFVQHKGTEEVFSCGRRSSFYACTSG